MSNRLALPMYAIDPAASRAFWQVIKDLLVVQGLPLAQERYGVPQDLLSHWRSPELLLSQSCGFPLMTLLPDVQVVGTFHYAAPGCEGPHYRSWLVAPEPEKGRALADFRGHRVVCNAPDSWSGYNVLLSMVAPLRREGGFFAETRFSGSHRASLLALRTGEADIAAIDCVTWALLQRHEPALLSGLCIIDQSPPAPGLPLITGAATSGETLAKLRAALTQAAGRPEAQRVLINGFSEMTREAWRPLLARREAAAGQGITRLAEKEI